MPRRIYLGLLLFALLGLAACRNGEAPSQPPEAGDPLVTEPAQQPTDTAAPVGGSTVASPTAVAPTAIPPSPTPSEPLAALVNDRPVFLAAYEKELARYEQAQSELGLTPGEGDVAYRAVVLDALIETELIGQAAAANSIAIPDETLNARLAELEEASGGAVEFDGWLQANQWTREEFRDALAVEMLTEKTVEFVTADVPFAVEQVRARYLQVDDSNLAQSLLDQVRGGADFAALAQQHSLDRVTGEIGGDLGYFAQGSLLVPEVEVAAFSLQPGQVSEVIGAPLADGSGMTYYLVQVIERDPQRQLDANLRFTLLQESFEEWLGQQWTQAQITRFVDTGT